MVIEDSRLLGKKQISVFYLQKCQTKLQCLSQFCKPQFPQKSLRHLHIFWQCIFLKKRNHVIRDFKSFIMDIPACALQRDPISFSHDFKQTYLSSDRKCIFCPLRLLAIQISLKRQFGTKRKSTVGISAHKMYRNIRV